MKMPDSRACVAVSVLLDPAGQLMMGPPHPNLIIKYSQWVNIKITCTHMVLWASRLGRVQGE